MPTNPDDRRRRLLAATRRILPTEEIVAPVSLSEVLQANLRRRFEAECEEADPEDDDTVIWEPMVGRVRG